MKNIFINTHSSICIGGDVYIDPYEIKEKKHNAKVIFLTHSHYDHLDMASINNIICNSTIIVAPKDCIETLKSKGFNSDNLRVTHPNDSGTVSDIDYYSFPSYNIGKAFHPKENGWVGYNLKIDGLTYTICGDTDITPELEATKTDILLIPIGGTYTMTAREAATLTNIIKPKVVIPVHYNNLVGTKKDEEVFINSVDKSIKVQILIK